MPWKVIALVISMIGLLVIIFRWQEHQRMEHLQNKLTRMHQRLAPDRSAYALLLGKMREVLASPNRGQRTAPTGSANLKLMRAQKGLYARIPHHAGTKDQHLALVRVAPGDAVLSCLGVNATSVNDAIDQGQFLEKRWFAKEKQGASLMKLRVVEEEMRRRIKEDLPKVQEAIRAQWLLVVKDDERGTAKQAEVWDLFQKKLIFATELKSRTQLIPLSYREGQRVGRKTPRSTIAEEKLDDCALGTQLKERLKGSSSDAG